MNSPGRVGYRKSLAFGRVDDCMVIVHSKDPPNDEDWNAWLEFNMRYLKSGVTLKCLVVTEGGAPSPTQRQLMNKKLSEFSISDSNYRNAIVTNSAFVRGVVTALSWFHPGYRAFSTDRFDEALDYLEVAVKYRPEIRLLVKSLQGQLARKAD
jgi:hypothetical protein